METTSPSSTGFFASLSNLCAGLVAGVEDRLQLLSAELHEEKLRLIQIFVWISAAVFTGMMAVGFASLAVVFMFSGTARIVALAGFAVLYGVALAVIVISFRRYLARQPRPFSATLEELKEDGECIRTGN